VEIYFARLRRDDGDYRAELSRPQAQQLKIHELVIFSFDRLPQFTRHVPVGVHIEQHRAGIADQAQRPTGRNVAGCCGGLVTLPRKCAGLTRPRTLSSITIRNVALHAIC